jgi:hypothetical protein
LQATRRGGREKKLCCCSQQAPHGHDIAQQKNYADVRAPDFARSFEKKCFDIIACMREPLAAIGADVFVLTPDEFGTFVKAEIERWSVIIKKDGIKLEP